MIFGIGAVMGGIAGAVSYSKPDFPGIIGNASGVSEKISESAQPFWTTSAADRVGYSKSASPTLPFTHRIYLLVSAQASMPQCLISGVKFRLSVRKVKTAVY
jgi:hypothetical protein